MDKRPRKPTFSLSNSTISANITDQTEAAIKIQKSWRRYIFRKKIKQAMKKQKKKRFLSLQILSSERTYCEHLKFIIKQVLQPTRPIINDDELHQILFGNIGEIYMIHQVFLFKFQQVMKDFNTYKSKLSEPLLNYLFLHQKFKETYTNYCFNYRKADKVMKILTENNTTFRQHLKKVGLFSSALSLESYMIKPVQRLCKYGLMLNQYYKNLQPGHIDYDHTQKVIEMIDKLVGQTNEQVSQFLNIQRFRELKHEYEDFFKKRSQSAQQARKLVYQSQGCNMINLLKQQEVQIKSIVVFNDLMMIIPKKNQDKPLSANWLYVRSLQNLKYFKNLLQVVDDDKYITFQMKSIKHRDQIISIIREKTLYKKLDPTAFVTVQILGTDRRQSFFKFYTVYIVQIYKNGSKTAIYPRFKTLLKIQQILMKKCLFIELSIPPLQKESPYQTLKSKTIQKRKLHIRQFLQRIFNSQKIMGINQIIQILQFKDFGPLKCLSHLSKAVTQQEITILLPNMQPLKLHINTKQSKIKCLKKKISQNLNFINSSQFQIFQIRNKSYQTRRLLYEDEPVITIYNQQTSFSLNPFADKLQYMYSRNYYLNPQQQFSLYKVDFIRLQLQLSVIRSQILAYFLEEQMMITFMCLFAMYINLPLQDSKITTFIKDIINGKKSYKIKNEDFKVYFNQVQKMVQNEQDQLVTVPFLIIKILSNCRLYQCHQFQVQIHQKCYKGVKKDLPSIEQKIIFGIKRSAILLLTIKEKHLIKTMHYQNLQSFEMHPNGIIFKFSGMESIFRIKTQQGFQIKQLITIYKQRKD